MTANSCLGFFFFAYSLVVGGIILPFLENYLFPNQSRFVNTLIISCPILTAFIGSLIAGEICLKIGRRLTMIIFDFIGLAGVIVCLIDSLACLFVGRLLIGLTIGISSVAAPLYFTEIVPVYLRGLFANGPAILAAFGVLIAALLGLLVPSDRPSSEKHDGTWRVLIALSMVPLMLQVVTFLLFFKKETPYYYVHKSKYRKAAKIIKKVTKENVSKRMAELINERDYVQTEGRVKYTELLNKRFRMALLACSVLLSLQYLAGLGIILVFLGGIFRQGLSHDATLASILGICTAMVNLFACLFSVWTTSQFGRRPLIVGGLLGTGFILLMYGILAEILGPHSLIAKIWLVFWPIPAEFSLGSILYIIVVETLPDVGVSTSYCFNWLFAFLTMQFFPETADALGYGWTFIMYALIAIFGACFLWFALVESYNKNQDEILKLYSGKKMPARRDTKAAQSSFIEAQIQAHQVDFESDDHEKINSQSTHEGNDRQEDKDIGQENKTPVIDDLIVNIGNEGKNKDEPPRN